MSFFGASEDPSPLDADGARAPWAHCSSTKSSPTPSPSPTAGKSSGEVPAAEEDPLRRRRQAPGGAASKKYYGNMLTFLITKCCHKMAIVG